MSIELERRALSDKPENNKRNLELSAYFTIPKLETAHRQIALISGMKTAYNKKNYLLANHFASKILTNSGGNGKIAEQVCAILLMIKSCFTQYIRKLTGYIGSKNQSFR